MAKVTCRATAFLKSGAPFHFEEVRMEENTPEPLQMQAAKARLFWELGSLTKFQVLFSWPDQKEA